MDSSSRGLSISLVIPAYNEEKWIGATLDSVVEAAPGKFKEIIVVDNASSDRTAEIAGAYTGVRVIREERKGTGFARDAGWRETTADLVAYLDADTRLRPGWVEKIVQAFARDENLVCMTGPYWFYDLPKWEACLLWLNWHFALIWNVFGKVPVVGGNFVIRRSALEHMGGLNRSIVFHGDDVDTGMRASRYGKVRLNFGLTLDSSGRRYKRHGVLRMVFVYVYNSWLGILSESPHYTDAYEEVR